MVWVVVFWRLGYVSLLDPDEAHYAELTREMLQAHSWLVPLLDGRPYIDKPVLFHWLQAAAVCLFGENEFAVRFPSGAAAVGMFGMTRWVGTELFDAEVGQWGALMFATIPATFALSSIGLFDMVYTLFLFGGVACLLVAALRNRSRLQYAGYALVALAILTKGPVALVLVLLWFATMITCSERGRRACVHLHWVRGLLVIGLVATPWFVWMWQLFGDQFVRQYLLAGNLWYFTGPSNFPVKGANHTFYLRIFTAAFFPWSLVLIGWLMDQRRSRVDDMTTASVCLCLWILVIVGFFTAARFKLDHYIFPAAPACCLLAARGWMMSADHANRRWTSLAVTLVALSFIVLGVAGANALTRIDLGLSSAAFLLPAALIVGGGLLAVDTWRRRGVPPRSLDIPIATLLAAYSCMVLLGLPVLERARPASDVGRWIAKHVPLTDRVVLYRLDRFHASTRYYAQRPITPLDDAEDVRNLIDGTKRAYIVMLRDDFDTLRSQGIVMVDVFTRRIVVGTSGKGFRRQHWGSIVIAAAP